MTPSATWDPSGTVLITGGTGGLGALVARHLVTQHEVRHLMLISRRGLAAEGAEQLRDELTAFGATVTIEACDAADRSALAALLQSVTLSGVVHAAGVVSDGLLSSLTGEQFDAVWRPKAQALANLDELTRDTDLSAFVVFSSLAGVLGGAGQANYAAANTFVDALVLRRRAEGRAALSLAWGVWEPFAGMSSQLSETDLLRMARAGIGPLSIAEGLELFDVACAADVPILAPAHLSLESLNPDTFRRSCAASRLPHEALAAAAEVASAVCCDRVCWRCPKRIARLPSCSWCGLRQRRCWATPASKVWSRTVASWSRASIR